VWRRLRTAGRPGVRRDRRDPASPGWPTDLPGATRRSCKHLNAKQVSGIQPLNRTALWTTDQRRKKRIAAVSLSFIVTPRAGALRAFIALQGSTRVGPTPYTSQQRPQLRPRLQSTQGCTQCAKRCGSLSPRRSRVPRTRRSRRGSAPEARPDPPATAAWRGHPRAPAPQSVPRRSPGARPEPDTRR
jgi:hypothetical protein